MGVRSAVLSYLSPYSSRADPLAHLHFLWKSADLWEGGEKEGAGWILFWDLESFLRHGHMGHPCWVLSSSGTWDQAWLFSRPGPESWRNRLCGSLHQRLSKDSNCWVSLPACRNLRAFRLQKRVQFYVSEFPGLVWPLILLKENLLQLLLDHCWRNSTLTLSYRTSLSFAMKGQNRSRGLWHLHIFINHFSLLKIHFSLTKTVIGQRNSIGNKAFALHAADPSLVPETIYGSLNPTWMGLSGLWAQSHWMWPQSIK